MGRHRVYRERNYAFGKQLLVLRTKTSQSQLALAKAVGVHRRSFQNWETGESYPKAAALQRLIAVLLRQGAFSAGQEHTEAAALWQLAAEDGQYPLAGFDAAWFDRALALHAGVAGKVLGRAEQAPGDEQANPQHPVPNTEHQFIDWGEAIAVPPLYSREHELATLRGWIVGDRCRVVTIIGLGGIGKSSLAMHFAQHSSPQFDRVVFRSLQNGPLLAEVLDQTIRAVSERPMTIPQDVHDKISLLVQLFRERRCLLILDNFESILQADALTGTYRTGYAEYAALLHGLSTREHQSCLLLTSREKPAELGPLEGRGTAVRTLSLAGLSEEACLAMLAAREVSGTASEVSALVRLYGGNPLALLLVAESIRELFGGDVGAFLATGDAFFNGMGKLLDQQCARSTPLEFTILHWLAVEREAVPLSTLLANIGAAVPQREVLAALESLRRRVLIEQTLDRAIFSLQPVILEYITDRLIEAVVKEIVAAQPSLLSSHALMKATAKDYVRRSQERLIVAPLLERLASATSHTATIEQLLLRLLPRWRDQSLAAPGYGPGNIINMLRLLRGHLRDLDLGQLIIRQAYLQGVAMQDASLAGAVIQDCLFTESFGMLSAVATSGNGMYWAVCSRNGEIRVWVAEGRTLHRMWQAHTEQTWALEFSPDSRTLVSGSWDGTVKQWDIDSGALLWSGQHTSHIQRTAFSPDGRLLASSGGSATVWIWDVHSGTQHQTLTAPGVVTSMAWSSDGAQLATGGRAGDIQIWGMDDARVLTHARTLTGHTNVVSSLVFAPGSHTLASAGWDGTVRLWAVDDACLQQTFVGHTARVNRVVWSPDGHILASAGADRMIRLWDIGRSDRRGVLSGHAAGVWSLAFTPDSRRLLSGSDDGTLRVWDIPTVQCIRVMEGHAISIYDVDWSPDGLHLVSASADALVTVWDSAGAAPSRVLREHTGSVLSVRWSPDGRWVASSQWDNAILLWNVTPGAEPEVLRHLDRTSNLFYGLAWSPDGRRLAIGTHRHGVHMLDLAAPQQSGPGQMFSSWIRHVAWHPDGAQVAGGGDNGTVYLWDAADGTLIQSLLGHLTMITSLAWSPDGLQLASGNNGVGSNSGQLLIWDMAHRERVHTLTAHDGGVSAIAWLPGGAQLVSGGSDGTLRWWDVASEVCTLVRGAHHGTVHALRLSPDGATLASCGEDGAIMLWDAHSGAHLRTLRRDRPYERLNTTMISGLTEAQTTTLRALGAHDAAMATLAAADVSAPRSQIADDPRRAERHQRLAASLPYQPTSFVGRAAELEQIEQLLAQPPARLLTLLGPGGIGKTRLAIELAARRADAFADGVAVVPLAAISAPSQIVSAIGAALELSFGGQPDPTAYLLGHLRKREMLLVLDNFEHVLDGAELVADILAHAPRVTILITSRERLRLQAEWLFEVDGLAYPAPGQEAAAREIGGSDLIDYSAVDLFVQRARQIQPALRLSEEMLAAVARICQHVAGIPLAVELAAASLRSISVAEIERQIANGQIELQATFRDAPARHRSMRAVFDHSWNLLSAADQALFRRMAVFRGSWTLAAAEHVLEATQSMLLILIDKSLIRYSNDLVRSPHADMRLSAQAPRFMMLEPLREYARERFAADPDAEVIRRRHAHYFMELAEKVSAQLFESHHDAMLQQLVVEHDNFRTALNWSLQAGEATLGLRLGAALAEFWRICGYVSEGRQWLERLLVTFSTPIDARLPVLHSALRFAGDQGDYARSVAIAEEGLALARTVDDQAWIADFLTTLGTLAFNQHDVPRARSLFEAALSLYRAQGLTQGLSNALLNLGRVVGFGEGDIVQARLLFAESLSLYQQLNDVSSITLVLLHQGAIAAIAEDVEQATTTGVAALRFAWSSQFLPLVGYSLALLALPAIMQREHERGIKLYASATQLLDDLGVVMPPSEQARYDHWLTVARQGVDSERFEAAWAQGLAMSREQAVQYAFDLQ